MADEHGHDHDHGHGDSGKKGEEKKLKLTEHQVNVLGRIEKSDQLSHLITDLYSNVANDSNGIPDFMKKGKEGIITLAQKIGGYKKNFKALKGAVGFLKYYLGRDPLYKALREAGSYLKNMEKSVKAVLYATEYDTKQTKKLGLKALAGYAIA